MNKLKLGILLIIIAFSIKAQELPIIGEMDISDGIIDNTSSKQIVPVLKGTRYIYKDLEHGILVIFIKQKLHSHLVNVNLTVEAIC